MRDLIVLRPSPDWPRFDLAESRAFLAGVGFDPNLVMDFAGIWDRTFTRDYRWVREAVKQLSLRSYRAVAGAELVLLAEFDPATCEAEDRILFADDDDWLAPELFAQLPRAEHDGYRWGSLRVGLDFDPTAPGAQACARRPLGDIVYTNNYALSGRGLNHAGLGAVDEHTRAQQVFRQASFHVHDSARYLSCAVKHPCSTVAVRAEMGAGFREAPVEALDRFWQALAAATAPLEGAWLAPYLDGLRAVFSEIRVR